MNTNQSAELFSRAVANFVDPDGAFQKNVLAKARGEYNGDIVIKLGIDPTRPDIHLGHAVILRKLRAFQDIGCKVIFLIGDYTSLIGDPTGKSKTRPELTQKEIEANMKTYLDQVGKILSTDSSVFSWIRNSDWFVDVTDIIAEPNTFVNKAAVLENTRMQKTHLKNPIIHTVSLSRVLGTLRHITHARLIERDMFQARITAGEELHMHEMLYPVLQGIDSSVLAQVYGSCDLEIGGTDQTFNMLMGRDVMKMNGQPLQAVMSLDILEGLDGKEKMSKSLDNYVAVNDEPADMYGKILSVPDALIARYFRLATPVTEEEIVSIEKELASEKTNPKDIKMRLARIIVELYHGPAAANAAEESWVATFSKGEIPEDVPSIKDTDGLRLVDVMIRLEVVSSKAEARRLIEAGAVTLLEKEEKITDVSALADSGTYRVGKIRFFRIEN